MNTHVMLDLETWGKDHNAILVSIGAVKFDPNCPDHIQDSFYVAIDPVSCEAFGLTTSADTLTWWMDPKQDAARAALAGDEKLDLPSALDGFAQWFGDDKPVWGNGVSFDNVILSSAYKATGLVRPWSYKSDRDFRTMKNLVSGMLVETPPVGVSHHALDDATWQAHHLQNIGASLGIVIG